MRQRCKKCGAKSFSELCFKCKPNNSLSPGNYIKSKPKIEETNKMHEFFLSIWRVKPHVSEISREPISFLSTSFHHILLKSKTPEAKYDPLNVVLLTQEEHGNIHIDENRYPEINRRRELLLSKYGL